MLFKTKIVKFPTDWLLDIKEFFKCNSKIVILFKGVLIEGNMLKYM